MENLSMPEVVFIITAFAFQVILICHFALRKWRFELAIRFGRMVYATGIPAALISIYLLRSGLSWYFWLGGFLYLIWASYGYYVEYVRQIEWRSPVRWAVLGPYITLYLATVMFYWWPLAKIYKPLWYVSGALFVISTLLNLTSHHRTAQVNYTEGAP